MFARAPFKENMQNTNAPTEGRIGPSGGYIYCGGKVTNSYMHFSLDQFLAV